MKKQILLLLACMHVQASAQMVWFEDQFNRTELGQHWKATSGTWKIDRDTLSITTADYDQLLASNCYVYGLEPFSCEVVLRGIRAGVYFNLETAEAKTLSHMVRFDEKSILTGYMNAAGEFTATSVFDLEKMPTDWTVLRIDVDPKKRSYGIFVNGKAVGVDDHLRYGSGYIGLQASDGLSEFKSVKVVGKGQNIPPVRRPKGSAIGFQHVGYVQAVGQNLAIYNPESGLIQTLDPDGKLIDESVPKMKPEPSHEAVAQEQRFLIEGKRILIKNETGTVVDSITERLVAPSCLLTDYAFTHQARPSLFVSDPGASAIHKFELNGTYVTSFTAASIGGLIAPRGMDLYGKDEIVIADYNRLVFVKKNLTDVQPDVTTVSPHSVKITWPRTSAAKPSVKFSTDGKTWSKKGGEEVVGLNSTTLDTLTPLRRYSYKFTPGLKVIPPEAGESRELRFTTSPYDATMMAYTRLRVMCMVYRTISYRDVYPRTKYPQIPDGRTITDDELNYLREACKFNSEFYFRNSACKILLDFDFYVVQDTLWLHELGDKDPYWLSCNERVTRDYEKAVQYFGRTPSDYDGLVCPYAWVNYPPRRKSALSDPTRTDSINIRQAYGGGTNGVPAPWKYGKTTGYTGNPFQDRFSRQDWLITHEFHHQIDALMEASGYPEYYHADQPWKMPGRFGEDFDFNAHIIRNARLDSWLDLKFGTLAQTRDLDHDGVPDDDPTLPFDEKRLGGDPTKKDTDGDGLSDLQEVVAGMSIGSRLDVKDTDQDGINDERDAEPLYPIPSQILHVYGKPGTTQEVPEGLTSLGRMTQQPDSVSAFFEMGWDEHFLYLFANCMTSTSKNVNLLFQIDANNDGWFHGFDNFQIRVRLQDSSDKVTECYLRDCSSWTDPPQDSKDILDSTWLSVRRERFILPVPGHGVPPWRPPDFLTRRDLFCLMRVPANEKHGLDLIPGKQLSVRIGVQTTEDRWVWDELFERNYMMTVELK